MPGAHDINRKRFLKLDSLLVNGDSYSVGKKHQSYADFLGLALDLPVHNLSVVGSNNDRIVRSTIEKTIDLLNQGKNPLVIIGWSFIRRIEVWYYGDKHINIPDITEKKVDNPRFVTLDLLLAENMATLEQKSMITADREIHKMLTDFYCQLYLLSNWLEKNKIQYLFFSAANNTDCPINCFPYVNSLSLVKNCENNPAIYRLHEFCIPGWAQENDSDADSVTGHLSPNGHEKFSLTIKSILEDIHGNI